MLCTFCLQRRGTRYVTYVSLDRERFWSCSGCAYYLKQKIKFAQWRLFNKRCKA